MDILESTRYVVENADSVSIDDRRVRDYADTFARGDGRHWLTAAPFDLARLSDTDRLAFLFVFNALSFCYWGEPKWTVEHDGKKFDGAWGMIVALGRAAEEGVPILQADFCRDMSADDFAHILRANVTIPLFEERLVIVRELGRVASASYFPQIVAAGRGEALTLLDEIVETLESFRDEASYKGKRIHFAKRAQVLVSDLHSLFGGEGYGRLANIDKLTACADYKLPQILRKLGVMRYAEPLAEKIDSQVEIVSGSAEEVEIRACTVHAVERIRARVVERLPGISSSEINDRLWLFTQEKFPDDRPYHRTRTTAY
ncbi:MAG: queuosine salvage family protein [bacterium]